jgi:hypothetical protein
VLYLEGVDTFGEVLPQILYGLSLVIEEIGPEILQFMIYSYKKGEHLMPSPIVTNTVGQVFGQRVQIGRGYLWVLPAFDDNPGAANIMLSHLDVLRAGGSQGEAGMPTPTAAVKAQERDVFISYASEDKIEAAKPLADMLIAQGLTVWFDDYELVLGDRLRERIDAGLSTSRFGVTVLSHHFFQKDWPKNELEGLLALERGMKKILPVWHNITKEEVEKYSPTLAGRLGVSTSKGLDAVVAEILRVVKRPA